MNKPVQGIHKPIKVRQIGNSSGIVLPKDVMAKLGVQEGDELNVVETPDGIELQPFDTEMVDAQKWIEKGAKRYRNTLRALSK